MQKLHFILTIQLHKFSRNIFKKDTFLCISDLTDWSPGGWDFYKSMLVAYRDLQISPFFRVYVDAEHNNGTMTAYLTVGEHSLPLSNIQAVYRP
jgi:hypothetical protein